MDRSPTPFEEAPGDAATRRLPVDLEQALAELERIRSADVDARYARAVEIEGAALAVADERSRQRARLVIADMLPRRGDLAGGARIASEVRAWAEATGDRTVLARAHLVLSSVFTGIGDAPSALDHAVRSVEVLPPDTPARERGSYLMGLANALSFDGSVDEARLRYGEAEATYADAGDTLRALDVLNNLVVLEYENGDPAATGHAAQLEARARAAGEMCPDFADTIARSRLADGDLDGAAAIVREGLGLLTAQGDAQAVTPAELHLTHAEIALARGRVDEAAAAVVASEEVCTARHLQGMRAETLRVRAKVHAAAGEYQLAYETHQRFHDELTALRRRQQAEAARTRHAVLATAEARQDALRFRVQARTDALTGLHNRRFVDETLPSRLNALGARAALVAAIIDIDHFKRINDRCGHEVGDRVLALLARQFERTSDDGQLPAGAGFAARLGGEEFLLVLPAADDPSRPFERLRQSVAAHDWSAVAPDLRVTISVGVAVSRPGDTQHSLLARADAFLYQAKAAGRDQVVVEAGSSQL